MAFKVFFHNLFRYVARSAIVNCPQVFTPVSFFQHRVLALQQTRTAAFQTLHQVTEP